MKRMFYKILILVTVFCFTELLAQIDTTRKDFYPLKIGNLWQYRNESNFLSTEKIIGDTIIDGHFYYNLVNVVNPSLVAPRRIDSLLRVIHRHGGPFWGDISRTLSPLGGRGSPNPHFSPIFEQALQIWRCR